MGRLVHRLVDEDALLWRQRVVGCRRYVAHSKSELIGINQNQSEKIGLVLISSDKLRLVSISFGRQQLGQMYP